MLGEEIDQIVKRIRRLAHGKRVLAVKLAVGSAGERTAVAERIRQDLGPAVDVSTVGGSGALKLLVLEVQP